MPWQKTVLEAVAGSDLAASVTFGGGTALAVAYLHHRLSEDIDFFSLRELQQHEIEPLARALSRAKLKVDQAVEGPRRILVLSRANKDVGHIDRSRCRRI